MARNPVTRQLDTTEVAVKIPSTPGSKTAVRFYEGNGIVNAGTGTLTPGVASFDDSTNTLSGKPNPISPAPTEPSEGGTSTGGLIFTCANSADRGVLANHVLCLQAQNPGSTVTSISYPNVGFSLGAPPSGTWATALLLKTGGTDYAGQYVAGMWTNVDPIPTANMTPITFPACTLT